MKIWIEPAKRPAPASAYPICAVERSMPPRLTLVYEKSVKTTSHAILINASMKHEMKIDRGAGRAKISIADSSFSTIGGVGCTEAGCAMLPYVGNGDFGSREISSVCFFKASLLGSVSSTKQYAKIVEKTVMIVDTNEGRK